MQSKVIISGRQIICSQILTIDINLPSNKFFFVRGVVFSPKGEPLSNAAVEIILVHKNDYPVREESIGVTFTMENGCYGASIPYYPDTDYKLIAYALIESV